MSKCGTHIHPDHHVDGYSQSPTEIILEAHRSQTNEVTCQTKRNQSYSQQEYNTNALQIHYLRWKDFTSALRAESTAMNTL